MPTPTKSAAVIDSACNTATRSFSLPGLPMMPVSTYVLPLQSTLLSISDNAPFLADTNKQPKMIYAASKEALKRSLEGFAYELQANDSDDLEHSSILNAILAKMNA